MNMKLNNMKFVCFKVLYLFSTLLPSKCSAVPMSQHATSSQSIVFNPGQITSTAASPKITEENDPQNAKYEYKYEVSDLRTGDRKTHWESRHGDVVRGVYTLYEPDGALRTVEYTADALHGFNAVVRRNVPSPHQYPRTKPSLHSFTKAQDDGKAFKTDEPNDFSHNPAQGSFYNNLGVDFTVNHVLSNDSGRRKYY